MNLKNNVELIRQKLPDLEPIAVVKDDAYGHDAAVVVPRAFEKWYNKVCSGLCKRCTHVV